MKYEMYVKQLFEKAVSLLPSEQDFHKGLYNYERVREAIEDLSIAIFYLNSESKRDQVWVSIKEQIKSCLNWLGQSLILCGNYYYHRDQNDQNHYFTAIKCYDQAIVVSKCAGLADELIIPVQYFLAHTLNLCASCFKERNDFTAAIQYYERADTVLSEVTMLSTRSIFKNLAQNLIVDVQNSRQQCQEALDQLAQQSGFLYLRP